MDTIFAISSGRPPAAIAVLRVSGPGARAAGLALAGTLPPPRNAALRTLRDDRGDTLDRALTLWFPGPATATGEDLLELHLHGGRAVVAAVERALVAQPGLRRAEPGEFTRRALLSGRIDLAQAEGLADLLEAETETQRRAAISATDGALSAALSGLLDRLGMIAAQIEASLDFDDEDDVGPIDDRAVRVKIEAWCADVETMLARPTVERLREGIRIVIAGPPNAGKSSLFNALIDRDAAIVTSIAGTTRDCIEASIVRNGIAYTLVDTAGLAERTADPIEALGIVRARNAAATADIALWLGDDPAPIGSTTIAVHSRMDEPTRRPVPPERIATSVGDSRTIDILWDHIESAAMDIVGATRGVTLRNAQRAALAAASDDLRNGLETQDPILIAEAVRIASRRIGALLGIDVTEAMLDRLFARFCIGK